MSAVQGGELEHNVGQTLSASSKVTETLLLSQGQGVWLAGRTGCLSLSRELLSNERWSSHGWASETASVSLLHILSCLLPMVGLFLPTQ